MSHPLEDAISSIKPRLASNYHRCSNRLHRLSAHSAEQAAAGRQIDDTAAVVPLRLKFCWCIEYDITPQTLKQLY